MKRNFVTLDMKGKDTIQNYYDKLMGVVNKIWPMEEDISDDKVVENFIICDFAQKIEGNTFISKIFKRYK